MGTTDPDQLRAWRDDAMSSRQTILSELGEIQRKAKAAEQRVKLLDDLLALDGGNPAPGGEERAAGDALIDAIERLIRKHGSPMRIGEIHAALLFEGVALPGKGDDANIIAKIQRSNGRIVRVARGLYDVAGSAPRASLVYPDGRKILLQQATLSLGRADDNEVILTDTQASRHHARITLKDGGFEIADIGSSNGVFVNGKQVAAVALKEGDRILLGSTELRFTLRP